MLEKTLQLAFSLQDGKTATISIKDPKSDLTEQEIKAAVSTIVQQQAFAKDGIPFGQPKTAKLIERFVTTYDL